MLDPRFRQLTTEILGSLRADLMGDAVVQHVHFQLEAGQEKARVLDSLPSGFRAIYLTWLVDIDVANGGFNQFFYNPSAAYAGDALGAYELLGAEDYAAVMRSAIAIYETERDQLASYHDAGTLEAFSESYQHTKLGAVDALYYALQDRIYRVWADALRDRQELFEKG